MSSIDQHPFYSPGYASFDIPSIQNGTIHNLIIDESLNISNAILTMTQYDNTSITYNNNQLSVKDLGINTTKIVDSAITNIKLALNSVATGNIQNIAITNALLGLLSVATGNIQDNAIITSKMGLLSVTNAILALNSVATGNIQILVDIML
jgi:hypothetical protein